MTSKISNEESNALEGKITSAEVLNFLYKKLKMTRVQGLVVLVVNFESFFLRILELLLKEQSMNHIDN